MEQTDLLPDEPLLDALRREGDPAADAVIADLGAEGPDAYGRLRQQLGLIDDDHAALPADFPEPLKALLRSGDVVGQRAGGWDEGLLRAGAEFFFRYGMQVPLVLHMASLPLCYAAQRGVKVLCFTEQLERRTLRRVAETAQLVIDVMDPDGLLPQGRGRVSLQKVRLMHAGLRLWLRITGRWDCAALGWPLCQEDMLGTLMTFSVTVVDGLRVLGAQFHDEEAEAYYYRWRAAGQLLGIRPDIIPPDLDSARRVFRQIQARQYGPSPEGRRLTLALRRMLEGLVPGQRGDWIVAALMRHLLRQPLAPDDRVPDMLGIPQAQDSWGVLARATELFRLEDAEAEGHHVLRWLAERVSHAVLDGLLAATLGGQRAPLTLAPELLGHWVAGRGTDYTAPHRRP